MTMGNFIASICCSTESNSNDSSDDSSHHVDFSGGNVHCITSEQNWEQKMEEARKDGKIVIANFSASWCGPCRMIAPFFCELSENHPSLMFLVVDVDKFMGLSSSWDVKATPTFILLRDGKQFDKVLGANKPELQKKIADIIDSDPELQKNITDIIDPDPELQKNITDIIDSETPCQT